MRGDWRGETQPSAALDAVLGAAGITQYRGYFEAGEERYAKASAGDVEQVLRHFGASWSTALTSWRACLLHTDR
jgi:hypothetical protein